MLSYPEIGGAKFKGVLWAFKQQLTLKNVCVVEFSLFSYKHICNEHFGIWVLFLGCEMVTGDMNDVDSLVEATRGAHGVFILTDYYATQKKEVEVRQVEFSQK